MPQHVPSGSIVDDGAAAAPQEPVAEKDEEGPHFKPPGDPFDVVFKQHKWALRRPARMYEMLWRESVSRRDEVWRNTLLWIARHTGPTATPEAPSNTHPALFVHALRTATSDTELRRVVHGLEETYTHAQAHFVGWAALLVSTLKVESDSVAKAALTATDRGLLYEIVLDELQKADGLWTGPPPGPSVRVAAMLHEVLVHQPFRWTIPDEKQRAAWKNYVTLWRRYHAEWEMPRQYDDVYRVLLVPGESTNESRKPDDSAAVETSKARAENAVGTIRWHLDQCPHDKTLIVLVSGGQVRSASAEAEIMAAVLNKPTTWGGAVPDRLEVVQDGLARHTSNNLRSAAQIALRSGLAGFWVQTGMNHALYALTGWKTRYLRETTWGLSQADRDRLAHVKPMVRRPCGPGANPAGGRARYQELRSLVFVPAIGDALNP